MGLLLIVAILVVLCAMIYMSTYNNIKRCKMSVDQSRADIEIYMVKRYDVLKNSLEVVKEFTKHETETFKLAIEARRNMTIGEMQEVANNQNQVAKGILALAESYPELKSQDVYTSLQRQLSDENAHYAAAKRAYNSNVNLYNQAIVTFPGNIIAPSMGAELEEFLKDDEAEDKKNADIKF